MRIHGYVRVDASTKNLLRRLRPGEVAVIDHADLDELAARALVDKRARAVLNAAACVSGRYPNPGPGVLLAADVPVIDGLGHGLLEELRDRDEVSVCGGDVFKGGKLVASGDVLSPERLARMMAASRENAAAELRKFLANTLEYVHREKDFFLGRFPAPALRTRVRDRHVLVVVRGQRYKEDLAAIWGYISEMNPVLIGVDGGADALVEHGYRPDAIVGDMDSVSDAALCSGAELVVHAYPDGRAPGLSRLGRLRLEAHVVPSPGTSEDLGLLLAFEMGARLIVAVGTHSGFIDFLEKGRPGMASTFLVRLKIGSRLVDARGVSLLYQRRLQPRYLYNLLFAALLPAAVAVSLAPPARSLLFLWWIQLRVILGF